jgi:uncharacterized protein YlxW (UPF0749 family)
VGRHGGGRSHDLVLPALILVLAFLITAAVAHERARERRIPAQTSDLADLVRRRQADVRGLAADVRSLSRELVEVQERGAGRSDQGTAVGASVERLRAPAGLEAVRGPGLTVELADSPDAPTDPGESTDLRIQDLDLQLMLNALWAGGAEAVAVNGHRVAGGAAIRQAGGSILVNYRAVVSPYRLTAIGEPEGLRRRLLASEIARQFETWTQVYGLGFSVRTVGVLTLPALPEPVDPTWARPVGEG